VNTKIVLSPRCVPAAWSCSDAIAMTSPIGESRRPAVERRIEGSPPSVSDAVLIQVLVRDQQQVRLDALDRRILELHPSRGQRRDVAEGVDKDRSVVSGQPKRGYAVPINAQRRSSRAVSGGRPSAPVSWRRR
jgi:hypothetical protein